MGESGWHFASGPGVVPDPVHGVKNLYELYQKADPSFTGRVTVPVVWDKQKNTIVNNESSEVIRMLNSAFDHLGAIEGDYYPETLREEIDHINDRVYETVNNGVYRCGFATTQSAYDNAVQPLFDTLEWLEDRLKSQRYLLGDRLTEADIRLFTTLIRFDLVYAGHFKCNIKRLVDYPALWAYTRDIYQMPQVKPMVNFHHIQHHYYESHRSVNPTGIVPAGPRLDFDAPANRAGMSAR